MDLGNLLYIMAGLHEGGFFKTTSYFFYMTYRKNRKNLQIIKYTILSYVLNYLVYNKAVDYYYYY